MARESVAEIEASTVVISNLEEKKTTQDFSFKNQKTVSLKTSTMEAESISPVKKKTSLPNKP
jgi:hypothetical protein